MDYKLQGYFGDHNLPCIDITVGNPVKRIGLDVSAVIDTGAAKTCIKQTIADLLQLDSVGQSQTLHPIKGIIDISTFNMSVRFGVEDILEISLRSDSLHIPTYPYDMVIGCDIISKSTLTISKHTNTVSLIIHSGIF